MKNISLAAALVFASLVPASCAVAQSSAAIGDWQGALSVQGFQLRIVFHVVQSTNGDLGATMDSPDQGANGIPVDSVTYANRALRIILTRLQGVYAGTMESGDSVLLGTWTQRGASLPLDLRRASVPIVIRRPQEPQPPYPYLAEDVTFQNAGAGITLAGTLTLPRTGGPFPAAVLITGSGAQDRDETIFNHKPFKVIADYLTRHGIAILRFDDRGTAHSTGVFGTATSKDFATDVEAAIAFLKSQKNIDKKHLGLIGHSEGGLIAPMVAAGSSDIAFIVLLAGPSLTGKQIILLQDSLIAKANGASPENIRAEMTKSERLFSLAASPGDTAKIRNSMRQYLLMEIDQVKDTTLSAEARTAVVERTVEQLTSPWFRFFLTYDPVPALERVECPVLALNGEKDLQVPPRENLGGIERALRRGKNGRSTIKEMPGLNHLFQHATTGSPLEYPGIEETFSQDALSLMATWIQSVISPK